MPTFELIFPRNFLEVNYSSLKFEKNRKFSAKIVKKGNFSAKYEIFGVKSVFSNHFVTYFFGKTHKLGAGCQSFFKVFPNGLILPFRPLNDKKTLIFYPKAAVLLFSDMTSTLKASVIIVHVGE